MDRGKANRWDWLPTLMPGVARQVAELRRTMGEAHVAECWRRGVIERQPGWFFAAEATQGAITVGVPWGDELMRQLAWQPITADQSLVYIRPKDGGAHGA